jgi:acetylornithine deacetylase
MIDPVRLAEELIAIDSRSFVSNVAIADRVRQELHGFDVEVLDYIDAKGVAKRNLVAHRGSHGGGLALAGHLDTVPDTGWTRSAFEPAQAGGALTGLGSADMKGPIAALLAAGTSAPADVPVTFVFTADEEAGKAGIREVLRRSELLRRFPPRAVVIGEPTGLRCIRGHRVDIQFTADAEGVQAHSSTGEGINANLALIPFLAELRELHYTLRREPRYHDPQYTPPFCDLNFVLDNYGAASNMTVGKATCRIKFRYSKSFDPEWVVEAVQAAARRSGLALAIVREASPPELPADHPLVLLGARISGQPPAVAGLGTEASELKALAPTIVMGPGRIEDAHRPGEKIDLAELQRSVDLYRQLLVQALELPPG